MLSLLTLTALARPAELAAPEECVVAQLSSSLPASGATEVPVDVVPFLVFEGNCGPAVPLTLTLSVAGGATVSQTQVDFAAFELAGETWLLEPTFPELEPSTDYVLDIASEWDEPRSVSFTTGNDAASPLPAGSTPTLTLDSLDIEKDGFGGFLVSTEISLAAAGGGDGISMVRQDGEPRAILPTTESSATLEWWTDSRPSEVCLSVIERDATGIWHGPSEESCMKSSGLGCSHTPPWLAGVFVLPLLGLRRQSRPC